MENENSSRLDLYLLCKTKKVCRRKSAQIKKSNFSKKTFDRKWLKHKKGLIFEQANDGLLFFYLKKSSYEWFE